MISTYFFGLLKIMLNAVAILIPNWLIPDAIEVGFSSIINSALSIDGLLPIGAILISLNTILFFHITVWTVNSVGGLISIVRGGGTLKI